MLNTINIGILCLNFDEAKEFYIDNLGFFITMDSIIQCDSGTSRRLTMAHESKKKFSIEFMHPSNIEQAHRVGSKGATINLFYQRKILTRSRSDWKKLLFSSITYRLPTQVF
ncbi:hypothetical protein [Janthinobacterium sp. PAMC25594]|uniref:hypothetical protein n=1 Tax=Janthinobacterium sp. PAMC25594 TaxID=2861284 RepID=UPI001C6328B4|nr:hypothetical protein [Janthinobacterium sp. PAMC25594]QYG09409.1 hypothetical protein KY494_12135 [Janthinobacterium sp. PAMC25594]